MAGAQRPSRLLAKLALSPEEVHDMANDLWGGEVSKDQAVQALASITGQNFPDLGQAWGDPTISTALSNANGTDRGPLGSCVYQVSGESGNRCLDNLTADQARDGFSGRWDQFRSCDLREFERVRSTLPAEIPQTAAAEAAEPAAPARAPAKAKRRPAKPAPKKAVKKRKPARAAKRAPAAARTKPKKKAAAKAKRRVVKTAAKKKPKRAAKKTKRR
jgi:hypothetical protein